MNIPQKFESGSMDDIIFNGIKMPLQNFAEVTIELDNFSGELPNNM